MEILTPYCDLLLPITLKIVDIDLVPESVTVAAAAVPDLALVLGVARLFFFLHI